MFAELISSVPSHNPTFVARKFTDAEISYCNAQPSPPSSFAARWVGKEAVFKSLGVASKGAAAAMKVIEIVADSTGAPTVVLHGDAKAQAEGKGIKKILLSLSHSDVSLLNPACELLCLLSLFRLSPLHSHKPRSRLRVHGLSHFHRRINYCTHSITPYFLHLPAMLSRISLSVTCTVSE